MSPMGQSHVMTLPEWPDLPKGAFPDDDALFPVVWERGQENKPSAVLNR